MARSRRTGRSRFTLVLLILASITLLTLDFRDSGPVNSLRDGAAVVFDPVRSAGQAVGRPFGNAWDGVFGENDLKQQNQRLRRQIDEMKARQVEEVVAQRDYQGLLDQLDLKQVSDIPTVAARIVSGPLNSFSNTLEIDRGSGDGLKKGMAVVTKAGLVGQVVRTTGSRATIELITAPTVRFGIRLAKLGDRGIAEGTGATGQLEVRGIGESVGVEKGDLIVTSGQVDSPIPPDIPVGTVKSVALTADQVDKTLVVEPLADLGSLTFVSVLLCDRNCG